MKHTPEDWELTGLFAEEECFFCRGYYTVTFPDGVDCVISFDDNAERRAHLIASSPDLLAALEQTTNALIWCSGVAEFAPVIKDSLDQGLAAIAKARGGAESAEG